MLCRICQRGDCAGPDEHKLIPIRSMPRHHAIESKPHFLIKRLVGGYKDTSSPYANGSKRLSDRPLRPEDVVLTRDFVAWYCGLKKITQNQLARGAGINPGYLSQLLRGDRPMTEEHLVMIAEALQVDSRRILPTPAPSINLSPPKDPVSLGADPHALAAEIGARVSGGLGVSPVAVAELAFPVLRRTL